MTIIVFAEHNRLFGSGANARVSGDDEETPMSETGSSVHSDYAALMVMVPTGCLPKARNAAIRASVGGCVENNLRKLVL